MVDRISEALSAYQTAASRGIGQGGTAAAEPAQGASFGDMVRDSLNNAIEASQNSEQLTMDATVGRADISDVVLAVNNAEMQLQTIVRIRDRMIQAYQEVARMPV